ncbi:uncharacterized protein BDZ99DRAFT_431051 [Mytilinidion resinicola]|uniref:RBR-type E3 ubiquitin transferase n=1 Tax=Mytilinidion resinicola TaxID=574789 RepID=A0A6A6Z7R2_9PEZI|nr:uncharacterized protein BDZ99DRAFT_431051 [Mytilinidion resinicola]KAF2817152.1 hypothetical protein BDZ99DRAFT_431051 [Mytilinidion resinicola]
MMSYVHRTCLICGHSPWRRRFPDAVTQNCRYPSQICLRCIRKWIHVRLEDGTSWNQIKCPGTNCGQDIRTYVLPEDFARYDVLATKAVLETDPDFHWCLNPKCRSGQITTGGGNIFTCSDCGFRTCVGRHATDVPLYVGETCEDYEKRRIHKAEEEKSLKLILQESKPCPGCQKRIEKADDRSCDHMTCSNCGYKFCWLCLADFRWIMHTNNSAHQPTCRHYSLSGKKGSGDEVD